MPLIMLVEDDLEIRQLLGDMLVFELGCTVETFALGEHALCSLEGGLRPDVIVFDVMMPGKDGNDLLRWRNEHLAGVPAIAITASPTALTEPGATRILKKPFSVLMLVNAVNEALASRPVQQ